jgi:hypothetical protein
MAHALSSSPGTRVSLGTPRSPGFVKIIDEARAKAYNGKRELALRDVM